jgi:Glycosyltransferase family 25 (LPS biosynthesis protein)
MLARRARGARLKARWDGRARTSPAVVTPVVDPDEVLARLDIVMINLDSRPDRLDEFTEEMTRLGIQSWRRLTAVDGRKEFPDLDPFYSGSIGCSLSHVEAFEQAEWDGAEALLICEDDVEFLVDKATIALAIQEFLDNPSLDVLALYGRARGGSHRISDNLRIVVGLVGTVCYVVKPHMTKVIGDLFTAGVTDLQQRKRKGKSDVLWNRLQAKGYFFASPVGSYTRNREGFSDIEGRLLGPR